MRLTPVRRRHFVIDRRTLFAAWTVASVARSLLGTLIPTPQIVTDEIRFIGIANDVAHARFRSPFSTFAIYPFDLYPTLLAPIFRWLPEHAYASSKILNAFLISSSCFPAWLLARRVLSHDRARNIALLCLCLPGLGYASTLMAENLYLPLSLWTVELALRWFQRRRIGSGMALTFAGGALLFTKAQGAYVLAALALLPFIPAFGGTVTSRVRWIGKLLLIGLGALSLFAATVFGRLGITLWGRLSDPVTWLGYYAMYLHSDRPRQWFREGLGWIANLFASGSELLPGIGIAVFLAAVMSFKSRRRAARLLGPLCLLLWVAFTREGIRLALYFDGALNVHERYTVQLLPILVILAADAVERRGLKDMRSPLLASAAAAMTIALIVARRVSSDHLVNDCPGLSWIRLLPLGSTSLALTLITCVASLWLLVCLPSPRRLFVGVVLTTVLTSAGMAISQRALAWSNHDLKMSLVPFAKLLAARGSSVFFLSDGLDIWQVWMAEAFTNEGEGYAYCAKRDHEWCYDAGLSEGRLNALGDLPPKSILIVGDPLRLVGEVVGQSDGFRAYQLDGRSPMLLGAHGTERH